MHNLHTLIVSKCQSTSSFINFLKNSGLCHKLEECVFDPCGDSSKFGIQSVVGLATSRKTTLKSARIVSWDRFAQTHVLKLKEYIPHMECGPEVALPIDDIGGSDEED